MDRPVEIELDTRNILLEAANFDLVSVRRTTQALKLPSEASLRFGKGIHPELPEPAARRASEFMRVLAAGTLASGMVDAYPIKPEPVVIELEADEVERNLGIRFGVGEIVDILEPLEFRCEVVSDDAVRVEVPEHRLDCQYPADLIEEVARIYGYDRIPVTEMADRLPPQRANRDLELEEVQQSIRSWIAHAAHADTWGLRRAVLGACAFRRGPATPGAARGFVEQQPEQPAGLESQQQRPRQPQHQQRVSLREHF